MLTFVTFVMAFVVSNGVSRLRGTDNSVWFHIGVATVSAVIHLWWHA